MEENSQLQDTDAFSPAVVRCPATISTNQSTSIATSSGASGIAKKRGRPSRKAEFDWTDEDTFRLIELWSAKEVLYNCKHSQYSKKDVREKALESILISLQDEGVPLTSTKQIQEKLTNLRNYFAAERRKIESSRKSGAGTESLYKSCWKFFNHLAFLQDNFVPRETTSNISESTPEASEASNMSTSGSSYSVSNPPSAKAARKLRERQREAAESVMEQAAKALGQITTRREKERAIPKSWNPEDKCFADMILQMLNGIADCEAKAFAKIEFQQKLIQLKYGLSQQAPTYHQQSTIFQAGRQGELFSPMQRHMSTPSPSQSFHAPSPYAHSFSSE